MGQLPVDEAEGSLKELLEKFQVHFTFLHSEAESFRM